MCGILTIINKTKDLTQETGHLKQATDIIGHRGPDDEGFLLWHSSTGARLYAGEQTSSASRHDYSLETLPEKSNWQVAMGHKRLSIIDLSAAGHQPMMDKASGISICYNGEIYNYKELKHELKALGHQLISETDTEVLLKSWKQWGAGALNRLNGMFAFTILDEKEGKLYAIRDRFGVKPLYYTNCKSYTAFCSEVKQLRVLPEYDFVLDEGNALDYLQYGFVDHNNLTFETGINQVGAGQIVEIDLATHKMETINWYELKPQSWNGNFDTACQKFSDLLLDSVTLRMRSDVPVGTALSGGLDSSTIVCLMRDVLNEQNPEYILKTVTSCFEDLKYDEWKFANEVIKRVGAEPYRVFPSFEKLENDMDKFIWHMDYPFGSTSQFSQWCVFEGAAKAGLKVMIDGQGADEQLAGYGGNDMALYTGLMGKFKLLTLIKEMVAYKKYHGRLPVGFLIGAIQNHIPQNFRNVIPNKYRVVNKNPHEWIKKNELVNNINRPKSLQHSLNNQVKHMPLPSLLRYEDRNSMAFSIESRVPFMDYRLIEFTLGLPEEYVYNQGEKKHLLRRAFRGKVPDVILDRKDKMGFVSAEEQWLKNEGKNWFVEGIENMDAKLLELVDKNKALKMTIDMSKGVIKHNFSPWHIICLNRFLKMTKS